MSLLNLLYYDIVITFIYFWFWYFSNISGQYKDGQEIYAVMHVTGFIRAWPPAGYGSDGQSESMDDMSMAGAQGGPPGNYCLVAVARLQVWINCASNVFWYDIYVIAHEV